MPRWKKTLLYSVSLIVVFLSGLAIDMACGPEPDPYDYSVSFFHNNISGGKNYRAFYFTNSQPLYEIDEPVNEEDVNSREWAAYLGGKVTPAAVKQVMYHLNHKTDSVLLQGYLNLKKQIPDSLKQNAFLHALKSNKRALLYYRFAKIIEPAVSYQDPWKNEPVDTVYLLKNATYALKQAVTAKSKFLKIRYYYQAQRLFHYTGRNKQAADIYDKYIVNDQPGYYINGLALGLRAGEERRRGNPVKAAYLFLRLFQQFPERRLQAYQNYMAIKKPERDIIALARNDDEKAVIYAMNGFHTPLLSTQYLRKVYNIAPRSIFVEILLTREINKLEAIYVTPRLTDKLPYDNLNSDYYGWNDSLKKQKNVVGHITELEIFCQKIAKEKKLKNPALVYIAKAYLEWMTGKNDAGLADLRQIDSARLNTRLFDQKKMVKLLLLTQEIKKLDNVSEQELAPSLTWLDEKVAQELRTNGEKIREFNYYGGNYQVQRFMWSARDFYQKLIAPIYLSQRDTTKAALAMLKGMPKLIGDTLRCYHQGNWDDYTTINFWQNYLHSSNLRKVIFYKQRGGKDPYTAVLTSGLNKTSFDCLYNLLGTAYLREHNYKKAFLALSVVKKHTEKDFPSDGYMEAKLKSNPFVVQLKDYPKNFHPSKSGVYSKLRFAKTMYQLDVAIKRNPDKAAQYYFAMATGLYNTSYNGNAWFMIAYVYSDSWQESRRTKPLYYTGDLEKTINAENLFLKARTLSENPEFKAKCTFMAAKCKQNRYGGTLDEFEQFKMFQKHADIYRNEIRKNSYFKELKKGYSATHFYKIAVNECSYLRDFLASTDAKYNSKKR